MNCPWTTVKNDSHTIAPQISIKPLFHKDLGRQKSLLHQLQTSCDGGHVVLVTHFAQRSGIAKLDSGM
jgi:predicted transcriptional regulator